jgi:hypothetical protein
MSAVSAHWHRTSTGWQSEVRFGRTLLVLTHSKTERQAKVAAREMLSKLAHDFKTVADYLDDQKKEEP